MKLSFPRWYITGSALVFAKVTRKDSTPFRCRRFNMLWSYKRELPPKGYPNKPVIILIPKLHGIRDIYSVHPISFHSFLPSLRRQSLYQASELSISEINGIPRLIKLIARYKICYRISHSFPGTGLYPSPSDPIVSALSSHPYLRSEIQTM